MAGWNGASTSNTSDAGATARLNTQRRHSARRVAANVASIETVPEELLGGIDRDWAFAWARRGYDVYACRDEDGVWYLWLESRCVRLGATPARRAPRRGHQQRH